MTNVDKTYWLEKKAFKLFGFTIFEIDATTSIIEGQGSFTPEYYVNKEYFESEFKLDRNKEKDDI